MTSEIIRQPALPPYFEAPGGAFETCAYLAYNVLLTSVSGLLAWWLLTTLPLPLASFPALLCIAVAGFGYYGLGIVSHEGFHFTLSRRKWLSAVIGVVASSTITGFTAIGFHLNHSRHHRYTNVVGDPDYEVLSQFPPSWLRLLYVRVVNNRTYLRITWKLLTRGEIPDGAHSAFSLNELLRLGWFNVAAQAGWIALYLTIFYLNPMIGVCTVVLPLLATAVISGAIIYAQHGDTGTELHDNARSHVAPLVTLLMVGTNYHLEHHLYPRVPCWRLPRVHAWLMMTPWATTGRTLCIEPGFWRGFLMFRRRFSYGPALSPRSGR